LLFCAVVSDIVPAPLLVVWTGGYYKRKQKYVKQKTKGNRVLTLSSCFGKLRNMKASSFDTAYPHPLDSILLLGPTGVGKSPLGNAISRVGLFERRCHHLDFGSELRGAVSDAGRSAFYTRDELDFIHGVLEQGLLLENEHFPLAVKIISLFLNRSGFTKEDILVLNGIPRHAGQARDIATVAKIQALCVLDGSADVVLCRIRSNVGGDRTEREDDNSGLIERKLAIFRERTAPLIEHYERQGSPVYRISVTESMTPADAYRRLSSLAAAHPPVALVAEPPQR
jgi:adenylate kinase family enzyme